MIVAVFDGGPIDGQQMVVESVQHELQCAIPEPLPIASPDTDTAAVRVGTYRLADTERRGHVTRASYAWRGVR